MNYLVKYDWDRKRIRKPVRAIMTDVSEAFMTCPLVNKETNKVSTTCQLPAFPSSFLFMKLLFRNWPSAHPSGRGRDLNRRPSGVNIIVPSHGVLCHGHR